ncbi:hypothetical protein HHI36_009427 [Cryptolaemus montrouzieri]|uniref:Phorbol-ester/DAG-type domain-containing protein n=1 Tax=Cryptolaemus montrouzieri TaxID=559131 RepID=A0ABD2MFF6_9CUCU
MNVLCPDCIPVDTLNIYKHSTSRWRRVTTYPSELRLKILMPVLKMCAHCGKKVLDFMKCIKCKEDFHPSCWTQTNSKKSAVCIHESEQTSEPENKIEKGENTSE